MIKGMPHVQTADGRLEPMTATKIWTLRELAKCPEGSGAVSGVLDGGTLAALVQFGLADRLPPDRIGGSRYAANEAGRQFLASLEPTP